MPFPRRVRALADENIYANLDYDFNTDDDVVGGGGAGMMSLSGRDAVAAAADDGDNDDDDDGRGGEGYENAYILAASVATFLEAPEESLIEKKTPLPLPLFGTEPLPGTAHVNLFSEENETQSVVEVEVEVVEATAAEVVDVEEATAAEVVVDVLEPVSLPLAAEDACEETTPSPEVDLSTEVASTSVETPDNAF
jgi:hypothetical protein